MGGRKPQDIVERLWEKTMPIPWVGCYLWMGYVDPRGYGQIGVGSRSDGTKKMGWVHKIAYESIVGNVPYGLELDHKCRNPACWRPEHLEPVTHLENMRRSTKSGFVRNRQKTHCPRGHPYSAANTIIGKTGSRFCRLCKEIVHREEKLRRRQGCVPLEVS